MAASYEKKFVISADDFLEEWNQLFEDAKDEKVCVVSFVGKGCQMPYFSKASVANSVIGRDVFVNPGTRHKRGDASSGRCQCYVEGHYSKQKNTVYLCLYTSQDTSILVNQCETLSSEISEQGVYKFWQNEEFQHARALLYMFHLSHIMVFVEQGPTLDLSYIRFFRTIESIRLKLQPILSDLIKNISVSKDWMQSARPCSPRVLFAFTASHLITKDGNEAPSKGQKSPSQRLQHAAEDQIYRVLRKSRVITNISNNSLFAIPANDDFVHIFTKKNMADCPLDNYLNLLRENCLRTTDSESPKLFSSPDTSSSFSETPSLFSTPQSDSGFKEFLAQHVELALTKGFDDNVGRSHVAPVFEIPTLRTWSKVASAIKPIFFNDTREMPKFHAHLNTLNSLLDVDNRFSENRCKKILPLAESTYQEAVPKHYTTVFHKRKITRGKYFIEIKRAMSEPHDGARILLRPPEDDRRNDRQKHREGRNMELSKAEKVYAQHARGPACAKYRKHLEDYCDKFWKNGHQLCEEVSLTGRHCIYELHCVSESAVTSDTEHLPVKPHSSQVKTKAACNCGRTQVDRDDPFTHKEANFDFYSELEKKCCGTLDSTSFPVFTPSIAEARSGDMLLGKLQKRDPTKTDLLAGMSGLSLALSLGQSGAGGSDLFLHGDQGRLTPVDNSVADTATQDESADMDPQAKEKLLSPERQHSTTEYLAGMVHSNSPPGLLPKFSSWSLCSLGKSTLYVPSQGLDQPGFVTGSNFLLPWDVTVKCDRDKWPSIGESSNKKGKSRKGQKETAELNMRIYIGIEYECQRGHRFFCSAPDKMVKASGGQLKDSATKLLSSDMALYFPCTCRPGLKTCLAQLIRVFISIPDGPLQVALNPKVQPSPTPCPIFSPEEQGPIKLTSGSLWVLRFPHIYMGDQGPLLPPVEQHLLPACRLLKGMFSIVMDS